MPVRQSAFTERFVDTVRNWDGQLLAPSAENRRCEGVQVFQALWFEGVFAKAHPIVPGLVWAPITLLCIYAASRYEHFGAGWALLGFGGGFLAWTLLEYLLHRYVFHLAPDASFESKLKQFMVHGYHHEFPNDRMRLVAPLLLSMPIGLVVAALYFALIRDYHWLTAYAGTVAGYLTYDWVHYYTHHFRPTTRLGRFLRRYHMEHHYKDSESHFGISSPLWDWVFGTAKSRGDAKGDSERSAAS